MAKFQYLDVSNLTLYTQLMTQDAAKKIEDAVSPAIKTISQSSDLTTLYFYTKEAPVTEDEAAFSFTIPAVDISIKADKVQKPTAGNFAGLDAKGNLTDSGKKASDFENAGAADEAKTELLKFIGTIPADAAAKNIVAYIKESVDAGLYDDNAIRALINGNTSAIAIINGTGEGSMKKVCANALTEFVAGAPENLDTYKELTDWILNHSSDAAEMNSKIGTNTANISNLKKMVGTLPAGVAAATVIDYIAEYVSKALTDSDLAQYAKADDLDAAVGRIGGLETDLASANGKVSKNTTDITAIKTAIGTIPDGAVAKTLVAYAQELVEALRQQLTALAARVTTAEGKISNLQTDVTKAKGDISTNIAGITALQGLVGDGFEPIPEAAIRALFT